MKNYARYSSGRIFENGFLEAASRVHPATPFAFYIPLMIALLAWALATGVTTPGRAAVFVPVGWFTWHWMEYALHRVWLHWEGNGPFTRRLHAIIHGYHHTYPDDRWRLVMPLGASIPLGMVVAGLLHLFGRPDVTLPIFVGIVGGYVWYDFLHFSFHHRKPKTAWGRAMRTHHLAHHFADPSSNFGISHRWLDRLFGTIKTRQTRRE